MLKLSDGDIGILNGKWNIKLSQCRAHFIRVDAHLMEKREEKRRGEEKNASPLIWQLFAGVITLRQVHTNT